MFVCVLKKKVKYFWRTNELVILKLQLQQQVLQNTKWNTPELHDI